MKNKILDKIYPIYTRLISIREVVRSLPDPILIYQMGKVGSSTIQRTLSEAGIPGVHVHYIDRDHWKKRAKLRTENSSPLPPHFHKGRLLRHWIAWTKRRVRVVSLVRDPIARYISEAFQTAHFRGFPVSTVSEALPEIRSQLTSDEALEYTYRWFEREFIPVFDIDIFDHPFDCEEGFGRISQASADILILTLEKLSDLVPTALSEFVGEPLELRRDRVRTGGVYAQVKNNLVLPEKNLRRFYDHPWMRHFYTDRDIEQFVERWSTEQISSAKKTEGRTSSRSARGPVE